MPTLICDLGGVLFTEVDPQRRIDAWSSAAGGALRVTSGSHLRDDVLRAFEAGRIGEGEYVAHLRSRLGWAGSDDELIQGWTAALGSLNLDVLEALSALREKNWQLIGATDDCLWDQRAVREQFGWVLSLFDRVVAAADVRACRPDPRFFAELRGAAGAGPRLYVDDDSHNVSGARRAGLDAHLFTTAAELHTACHQLVVAVG